MINESDLRLGMKVTVNQSSDFYEDWKGVVCTIVGLQKTSKHKKVDIALEENDGGDWYDGWSNEEIDLYEGN